MYLSTGLLTLPTLARFDFPYSGQVRTSSADSVFPDAVDPLSVASAC